MVLGIDKNIPMTVAPALKALVLNPYSQTKLAFLDLDVVVFAGLGLATSPLVGRLLCGHS